MATLTLHVGQLRGGGSIDETARQSGADRMTGQTRDIGLTALRDQLKAILAEALLR